MKYSDLVESFKDNPRDVQTRPMNNRHGKWFYVFVDKGQIYVTNAKEKKPSSTISVPRVLAEREMERVFNLYKQRKEGKAISVEAVATTVNQVYWYGVFAELGL